MKTVKVEALNQTCPLPVIAAKKAIKSLSPDGGKVDVVVDNDVAVKNISKMANGNGYQVSSDTEGETRTVHITATADMLKKAAAHGSIVASVYAFGSKTLGRGDDELGSILLKSYIYSLTQLDTPPEQMLFYNGGAWLTTEGSDVLEDLQTLADKGTQINTCGTCLDFYGIKDKLAIGDITNMYAIVETLNTADKVVTAQ
ncbi:MAG: sulfurtransferase-like selenium metabolism protein YedF [Lactobacillus sp.]|jgi:selenium metabolism protein YedF|nr:sulfurtransferase-like selenium metabolism protein YedF [Lactobacillus sp.]